MTVRERSLGSVYRDGSAGAAAGRIKWEEGWEKNKGNIENIIRWATRGKGRARFAWGVPCDFCRCFRFFLKYIKDDHETRGFCARLHHRAIGKWPGMEDGGRKRRRGRHCGC